MNLKKSRIKLKNLLLLILCLFRFSIRGRSAKKVADPKKFLIVQMAKLGDMVCTTPIFKAIKEKYPNGKIYILGNAVNEKLLDCHPHIDRYLVFKGNIFAAIRKLRKEKIDFACLTVPSPELLALLYLSGIPRITAPVITNGYCPHQTKIYNVLRKFIINRPHYMGNNSAREYLRLLEPINVFSNDTRKCLSFSEDANIATSRFFNEKGINPDKDFIVGIVPGTGFRKIKLCA